MYKAQMEKAKGGRFEGGWWVWVGWEADVGCKWRQLYLNNNKINKRPN